MLVPGILALSLLSQNQPAIDPSSVYGMKTFPNNPEFGLLPDKLVVGFAPSDMDTLTMHVTKGGSEITSGKFYPTDTPYDSFKVLRYIPLPTITLAQAGTYAIEFRVGSAPVSRFPFEIKKLTSGDEFNSKTFWDFITPVDKMGNLTYSTENAGQVWLNAWLAPGREGIPLGSMATIRLSHGGKTIAEGLPYKFQERENARRGFKLFKPNGRVAFTKTDILALNGAVVGTIATDAKALRKFTWTVSSGRIQPLARSQSDHAPRTDYWIPRRLAGGAEGYQFYHLEEQHWATSN